jgi:hypothetical protein
VPLGEVLPRLSASRLIEAGQPTSTSRYACVAERKMVSKCERMASGAPGVVPWSSPYSTAEKSSSNRPRAAS